MSVEIKHNYEWYRTGLVSVIRGSKKVTGLNTEWLTGGIKQGDALVINDKLYEIEKVAGSETISLVNPYTGDSAANLDYAIIPRAKAVLLADLAVGIQDAVVYWNGRDNNFETRITNLENQFGAIKDIKESDALKTLGRLGLFIDSDGDLAQDEEHIINSDNPDNTSNTGNTNTESGSFATEDEVSEMLDDIFN